MERNYFKKQLYLGVILLLISIFIMPGRIFAQNFMPNSLDELQTVIDNASENDTIDLVKLFDRQGFKPAENAKTININKDINITSSDPKEAFPRYDGNRAVPISNINFDIASNATLNLSGYLYLRGGNDKAIFTGDGTLNLKERAHIEGFNGNPAINMENGTVNIKNLMSYGGSETINGYIKSLSYKSNIMGGNSKTSNGADAIVAKNINIVQDNLSFDDYTSRGLLVRGGCGLGENLQGGFALNGENITINLSGEKNDYSYSDPNIVGGSGGYGQGAISGKNINIEVAGNQKIQPGNGVNTDAANGIAKEFYHGVIEIKEGGVLNFGTDENYHDSKFNSLEGFDYNYIEYSEEEAGVFFKNKSWSNFYGPSILAKKDAEVNILKGKFYGHGANFGKVAPNGFSMEKIPLEPIIKMENGILNIGKENQTDEIFIGGTNNRFNTSEAIIMSDGDINVYGENTEIRGESFTAMSPGHNGYINNPIAPKTGSAGIKTTGEVLIDSARVVGGSLDNMYSTDETLRNQYRQGSGIVGAKKVTLQNGAIVQGRGTLLYTKDGLKSSPYNKLYNISAGHGLEDVGEVIIKDSEVHGGDIYSTSQQCSEEGSCIGKGKAGIGIKGAKSIEIDGTSLITGGSAYNIGRKGPFFTAERYAGNAIDGLNSNDEIVTENLKVIGNVRIYGGGSSTKAGHAIANVKNVLVDKNLSGEPTIFGGGCRPTSNTGNESSGSGLYNINNAVIKAGKIEAGYKAYQAYIEKYNKVGASPIYSGTKTEPITGTSKDAAAIVASGKVIIDGNEDSMPKVRSYYVQNGLNADSIPSILLGKDGSLYVGKAEVYSGISTDRKESNILVKGGKYHVDIFKENNINSYDEAGENKGIKHKADGSVALYRILNKDGEEYKDYDLKSLESSPAYDDVFLQDLGLKLYKENENLNSKLSEEGLLRKKPEQQKAIQYIEDKKDITIMANDNIVVEKSVEPGPGPGPQPEPQPQPIPTVELTIDENYPDGEIKKHTLNKCEEVERYLYEPKREGYKFAGWNYKIDGSGRKVMPKDLICGNTKIYANWQKLPEDWNYQFVLWDSGNGNKTEPKIETEKHIAYIEGYEDGNIRPEGNITRAEAAALVLRLTDMKVQETNSMFQDAQSGAWYNKYVNKAYKEKMLLAEDNNIRPNEKITRAEFAKLISVLDQDIEKENPFKDVSGHRFEKEIIKAYANGRIEGYPDGTFKPDAEITRAEAVKILNSLFKRVADKKFIDENQEKLKQFKDLEKETWYYYEMTEAANSHEYMREENGLDEIWQKVLEILNR